MRLTNLGICSAAAVIAACLVPATSASAKEITKQQVAQFAATDRAPRTRTECIDRENGRTSSGQEWRACTEWRTEVQIYYRRSYLVLDGPKDLKRADRRLAESCMNRAVAAAQATSGEEGSAAAAPAARSAFNGCAADAGLTDIGRFNLSITERADWTGWR